MHSPAYLHIEERKAEERTNYNDKAPQPVGWEVYINTGDEIRT